MKEQGSGYMSLEVTILLQITQLHPVENILLLLQALAQEDLPILTQIDR